MLYFMVCQIHARSFNFIFIYKIVRKNETMTVFWTRENFVQVYIKISIIEMSWLFSSPTSTVYTYSTVQF